MTTEAVLARIGALIKSDRAPSREEVEELAEAAVSQLGGVQAATTLLLIARAFARGSDERMAKR